MDILMTNGIGAAPMGAPLLINIFHPELNKRSFPAVPSQVYL